MADVLLTVHALKHVAPTVAPVIQIGVTMLTMLISNVVTAAVSVGISWYISHRGMAGVEIDLNNAKMEIQKLLGNATTPAV